MSNYEEDLRIIAAASPGPWDFGYYNVCSKEEAMELAGLSYDATKNRVGVKPHGFGAFLHDSDIKVTNCGYSAGKSEDNARYIAHFDPVYTKHLVEKAQLHDHMLEVAKANGFDSLTAAIITACKCDALAEENEALTKRVVELERVLQLCAGYLDLDDAHERHAFNEVKELLK